MKIPDMQKIQNELVRIARKIRNEDKQEVMPVFFIVTMDEQCIPVMLGSTHKDEWASMIQVAAEYPPTYGIILQTEAWVASGPMAYSMAENGVGLRDYPDRKEVILSNMATCFGEEKMIVCDIVDGIARDPVVVESDEQAGRFSLLKLFPESKRQFIQE